MTYAVMARPAFWAEALVEAARPPTNSLYFGRGGLLNYFQLRELDVFL
jgi:hypothetical protein